MSDPLDKITKIKETLQRIDAYYMNPSNYEEYLTKNQQFFDTCAEVYSILDQWPIYQNTPAFSKYVKDAQRWANGQEKSYASGRGFNRSLRLPKPKIETLDEEMVRKAQMTSALNRRRSSAYQADEKQFFDDIQPRLQPLLFQPTGDLNMNIATFHGSLHLDMLEQAQERLAVVRARLEQVRQEISQTMFGSNWLNLRDEQDRLEYREGELLYEIDQIEKYLSKVQGRQSCLIS